MSHVLMIYRYWDSEITAQRVDAYFFTATGLLETRQAVCTEDTSKYWYMCFAEEFDEIMKEEISV